MSLNYVDAVAGFAPGTPVSAVGDPFVYENLVWGEGVTPIPQASLDSWIAANPAGPGGVTLTKYQFRKLFTFTERIGIDNFASNPGISDQNKAILSTIIKDLEVSGEVQLFNPDVAQGIGFLEQIGLIGVGRSAQILSNTPPAA